MTRPNVLMILTDDHAAHSISAYGSVVNQTPHIDRIARAGRRLEHCFVTNSICTPSRATILTGTYSHVNGVYGLVTPLDSSQPTFVQGLKQAGYRTAVFGKWHLGEGPQHNPKHFDEWAVLRDQGEYFDPLFITEEGDRVVEGYATDIITDMSLDWLERTQDEAPFCLLLHHKAPHRNWQPDEKHRQEFEGREIPVPQTFDDDYSTRGSAAHRALMRVADDLTLADLKQDPPAGLDYGQLARWKYQRYMQDYLACVASVDDNVGRVIDWLIEHEQFEDTLLIYVSDQGFFLGDHGWFDKRFMYEESLQMPFVVSYPRAIPASEEPLQQMVTNVDIARTILDCCGVAPDPGMQGQSFYPQLTQQQPDDPAGEVYYRYWENDEVNHHTAAHYGIRTERHKLIYFYNDGMGIPGTTATTWPAEWELYDLLTDPDELTNVYHHPDYAQVREELTRRLWQLQASVGDQPHHSQPVPSGL